MALSALRIGDFQFAIGAVSGVGWIVETAVGLGTTQSFVEEQKQKRDWQAFGGEAIGVALAVAFQQSVALELAEVVTKLIQAVRFLRDGEGCEDGLVNLVGGPSAEVAAAMQQHFQQTDDPGLVDFEAGITNRCDGDGQREAL